MSTAEIVSICSLTVFSLSLSLSVWSFAYNLRSSRVTQTERLHEVWWTNEMVETRNEVFAMCRGMAGDDSAVKALVAYYKAPLTTAEPPGRAAFAKLVGFFCNIEICLSSGVIDEHLTCRLFAEAHYADYQPLMERLRKELVRSGPTGQSLPHWMAMTVDLERRFARHGAKKPRAIRFGA
jgi:hypothetical protein